MDKIFVLKKAKFITGPFTLAQLIEKGLKDSDKIWHDGLTDWVDPKALSSFGVNIIAAQVPEIKPAKTGTFWKKTS
jgi:hypothetical protein